MITPRVISTRMGYIETVDVLFFWVIDHVLQSNGRAVSSTGAEIHSKQAEGLVVGVCWRREKDCALTALGERLVRKVVVKEATVIVNSTSVVGTLFHSCAKAHSSTAIQRNVTGKLFTK